jgi:hypothetical protein
MTSAKPLAALVAILLLATAPNALADELPTHHGAQGDASITDHAVNQRAIRIGAVVCSARPSAGWVLQFRAELARELRSRWTDGLARGPGAGRCLSANFGHHYRHASRIRGVSLRLCSGRAGTPLSCGSAVYLAIPARPRTSGRTSGS